MKKITYLLLLSLLFTQACVQDEDDLFEDSAANRMTAALAEYEKIIQDAPYGWVMDFYPGYVYEYGGYNFFTRFEEQEVFLSAEDRINGVVAGTEVSSLYSLVPDQSAVLSFDTYNKILHFFSEPKGSSDVDGYAGDYEFVFMNVKPDTILFRGKKRSAGMVMVKLQEPILNYLAQKQEMKTIVTATPRVKMVADGENILINLASKYLTYTLIDENGEEEEHEIPFMYDSEGLRLAEAISVNGVKAQFFKMDMAGDRLVSVDGKVEIPAPGVLEELCNENSQWYFDFDISSATGDMCDELLDILNEVNKVNQQNLRENITQLSLGRSSIAVDRGAQAFVFSSQGTTVTNSSFRYTMTPDYRGENRIRVELNSGGSNREKYAHFLPFIEFIEKNSPYDVKFDNPDVPFSIDFVSVNSSNVWFKVFR